MQLDVIGLLRIFRMQKYSLDLDYVFHFHGGLKISRQRP